MTHTHKLSNIQVNEIKWSTQMQFPWVPSHSGTLHHSLLLALQSLSLPANWLPWFLTGRKQPEGKCEESQWPYEFPPTYKRFCPNTGALLFWIKEFVLSSVWLEEQTWIILSLNKFAFLGFSFVSKVLLPGAGKQPSLSIHSVFSVRRTTAFASLLQCNKLPFACV